MSDLKKKQVTSYDGPQHKIRITLTSRNVLNLEKVCEDLIGSTKDVQQTRIKGPVRLPTKTLKITTRKSPCGEGTNTWDRFEMRIHKRVIDLISPSDIITKITNTHIEPGVHVSVTIENTGAEAVYDEPAEEFAESLM
eukprot:TRINITY_DN2592_c0_g1_i1.p1 TRINITY_DN2592_c0_g1~~TRINITY_DN2592_c0_g1_i1.p1  ORF type:complete len:138 (-),score=33.33 TRINITY_DN2592_c0_g1_i1:51-464(-)